MSGPAQARVLVADDEAVNVLLIANALKGEFDVVSAATGLEALERAGHGDIDLIILDVLMPGVDGFEICRRLKADPRTSAIPVIFVTGLEKSDDETHGFELGAVDYITKPIQPTIVRARVRTQIELKHARDLLEQLASVDSLTGVANRRRFDVALEDEWRRASRRGGWLLLAIVDVDHFKQFNDRHGHLAGDARLQSIATSLARSARRAGDLVARYGGEEFGVILPDVAPAMTPGIMRSLLAGIAAPGRDLVTVSAGAISIVPPHGLTTADALATADRLLYEAKADGRDRCVHLNFATDEKTCIRRV